MEQTIPLTYTPVLRQTVVGQVMEQIKELIASGRLKPGDKIPTEQELGLTVTFAQFRFQSLLFPG